MPTEIKGAVELRLALRKFAPDLSKETQKEMATALRTITSAARGFVPSDSQVLSNWSKPVSSENLNYRPFPRFSSFEAKKGIGFKTTPSKPNRSGFVALARVTNSSASGSIYETAGRKNPQGQPAYQQSKRVYRTSGEYYAQGAYQLNYFVGDKSGGKKFNNSLNPDAGKQFIENLNSSGQLVNARPVGLSGRPTRKQTGRLIFRAWAEDNGRANSAVIRAIENSAIKFDATMKKAS
jgi:hypothetical protein